MRESVVEKYLDDEVKKADGDTRKFTGRIHVPDRLVIWTRFKYKKKEKTPVAEIHFVETKAPGKKPRPGQVREHNRLRARGCTVLVLDTKAKVDAYVEANK